MTVTTSTLWVCTDCIMAYANGEDTTPEALTLLNGRDVAMGMAYAEHDCPNGVDVDPWAGPVECECETRTFSTATCEGCGTHLAGTRHAMTEFDHE